MVDVRRNHRTSARDFIPHELGLAILTNRNELHLRRNLTTPCVVHLRHVGTGLRPPRFSIRRKAQLVEFVHRFACNAIHGRRAFQFNRIAALGNPRGTKGCNPRTHVDSNFRIGIRPARIVDGVRLAVAQGDGPHRHHDVGTRPQRIHFPRTGKRRARNRLVGRGRHLSHARSPSEVPDSGGPELRSLRRHYPDQVHGRQNARSRHCPLSPVHQAPVAET